MSIVGVSPVSPRGFSGPGHVVRVAQLSSRESVLRGGGLDQLDRRSPRPEPQLERKMTTALLLIVPAITTVLFGAIINALIHRLGPVLEASPAARSTVVERLRAMEAADDEGQDSIAA